MLVADGLSLEQFTVLWRDAMGSAPDLGERCRLVLELGRATLRETQAQGPTLLAFSASNDSPITLMPMSEAPTTDEPALRQSAQERLVRLAADEAYVLLLLAAPGPDGHLTRLLIAWGESLEGDEAVWMQPVRWVDGEREEAAVVRAPLPEHTEISRRCKGLLIPLN